MDLNPIPLTLIDWNTIATEDLAGDSGTARMRIVERADVRMRLVTFSPGYRADHWCDRGHVVHVICGALTIDLRDGRSEAVGEGMSFVVGTGIDAHLVRTECGATVLIVD
jgi:quercetin dioxygenase-like cupin family protein